MSMILLAVRALVTLCLVVAGAAATAACPPPTVPPTAEQAATWAAKATDRGLLWRISKGGHSSYLFGSLHIGRAD